MWKDVRARIVQRVVQIKNPQGRVHVLKSFICS
jgi:hypothetical protein